MNITLNLSHEDVQQAVTDYVKASGHDMGDSCILFQSIECPGNDAITVTVSMELSGAPTLEESSKEPTSEPKKRVRRSKQQIADDKAQALEQAAGATNAEDKGSPEPETQAEETPPPETGNIADLEGEAEVESQPGSESLFATE